VGVRLKDAHLDQHGFVLLQPDSALLSHELAERDPWEAAARLVGEPVELVERQPIAPVPWGKSFASTSGQTPLHTDSQLFAGCPPDLQLMFCARPAERGGETTLLDGWALLDRMAQVDPELFRALTREERRIPFVFGEVVGPTLSLRRGRLVLTCSPMPLPQDPIAARLHPHLEATPVLRIRPAEGEVLVVNNHRMLHGRTAFEDPERKLTRLLVWLRTPLSSPEHLRSACAELALRELPEPGATRRRVVLEMLRGVPPGVLARRHGIDEATLYVWRDRALAAADVALGADPGEGSRWPR